MPYFVQYTPQLTNKSIKRIKSKKWVHHRFDQSVSSMNINLSATDIVESASVSFTSSISEHEFQVDKFSSSCESLNLEYEMPLTQKQKIVLSSKLNTIISLRNHESDSEEVESQDSCSSFKSFTSSLSSKYNKIFANID